MCCAAARDTTEPDTGAPVPPALVVLLVCADGPRRRRLAEACRAAADEVCCIETTDATGAAFAAPPDRADLIVVDGALAAGRSAAWLASLHRLAPRSRLIVLAGGEADARARLAQEVRRRQRARRDGTRREGV